MNQHLSKDLSIGILGVGNMGAAFARIFRRAYPSLSINLYNRSWPKVERLSQEIQASAFQLNQLAEFINQSDYIFVGVKPKDFPSLFEQLMSLDLDLSGHLWISMAVGLNLETLAEFSSSELAWARIMPNTPIEIGQGYLTICFNERVQEDSQAVLIDLLTSTGQVAKIEEDLFAISSAVAGSGPAFIYQLIEAMADAGVRHGLARQDAIKMASQTVKGAASMVLESQQHPALLKDQVTSPGGTTIEGLCQLEERGFRSAIIEAIQATYLKARD
ncbi:pyrroline-5-carboxylate reductase [Ignavigranum ruoffiae]|uniref:pyrroline-5-carboxylate reductase n=1 Tax=Ignavigranum ruoffiae TaxID=89093 RepID=UPI002057D9BC|nr:pyrroline-5-carboxylate reductase [Ignavigranum ruoffiae]UPQ85490.1 pyrroline-5-carboxylate reductase [Ignavigranum ruoffiae]